MMAVSDEKLLHPIQVKSLLISEHSFHKYKLTAANFTTYSDVLPSLPHQLLWKVANLQFSMPGMTELTIFESGKVLHVAMLYKMHLLNVINVAWYWMTSSFVFQQIWAASRLHLVFIWNLTVLRAKWVRITQKERGKRRHDCRVNTKMFWRRRRTNWEILGKPLRPFELTPRADSLWTRSSLPSLLGICQLEATINLIGGCSATSIWSMRACIYIHQQKSLAEDQKILVHPNIKRAKLNSD